MPSCQLHADYTDELHALYAPAAVKPEILALCNPEAAAAAAGPAGGGAGAAGAAHGAAAEGAAEGAAGEHRLSTAAPLPLHTHVLRLLPGDDLARSLARCGHALTCRPRSQQASLASVPQGQPRGGSARRQRPCPALTPP